jgi:hypothetical protein
MHLDVTTLQNPVFIVIPRRVYTAEVYSMLNLGFPGLVCTKGACADPVISMYNGSCTYYFHVQCVLYLLCPYTVPGFSPAFCLRIWAPVNTGTK